MSAIYWMMLVFFLWILHGIRNISHRICSESTTMATPPGSEGFPFIGETLHFMAAINSSKGFYNFVQLRRLRYGSCFRTNIFVETHVFVSSTESAKAILNNDLGKFTKRYIRSIGELVGHHSLLCASRHTHKHIRSKLTNLFSTTSLSMFIKQFDELIVKTLRGWETKGTVIVLDEALKITFKAMCKTLMSLDCEDEELEMLEKDVGCVCEAMLAFPLKFPWTRFYKGLQGRERFMKTLEKIINKRRENPQEIHEDFLQHLLTEDDETRPDDQNPSSLSDEQIKDNILTMIIAGQDTTASAITWMVKYLDENVDVLQKLRKEHLAPAKNAWNHSNLTLDDLNHMSYASKVVKETLRMASIVPWFPRLALEDCEIQGYKIKRGWNVNVDSRSIHHDPTFIAFGAGGRTCLGMNMAKAMMLVFLHRLITTYRWEVIDSDTSVEKWALFARLRSGCPIQVTRVRPNSAAS
ncbi:Cytochrome P450 [Dillenia turbinata]|uniref:Cytochrome P450 n=1 Tax=Dillenia turbinata TaxID=194707 RepID=A0AAN8W3W3_9MAGN